MVARGWGSGMLIVIIILQVYFLLLFNWRMCLDISNISSKWFFEGEDLGILSWHLILKRELLFIRLHSNYSTLHFGLSSFRNGRTGGSKWPSSLKIYDNEVKKLKLVSNLGNHKNFLQNDQKRNFDQIV